MKKAISLILVLAVTMSLLAGCAMGIGDTPVEPKPIEPATYDPSPTEEDPSALYVSGLFYRTKNNGAVLLSKDIGPIVLRNDATEFDDLKNFAIIVAETDLILESYPCQTTISNWGVTNKATLIAEWKDMVKEMTDMGYIPAEPFGDEEEPAIIELNSQYDIYAKIMDNIDSDKVLISPLSLNFALGMLANAASESDQAMFEEYCGMTVAEYNEFVYNYMQTANPEYSNTSVEIANGIWVRDNLTLREQYETAVKNMYQAEVAARAFNSDLVDEINKWASDKTHGMIDNVLHELHDDSASILANALYFSAEWENQYEEFQVRESEFTNANGNISIVEGLHQTAEVPYFENDTATAFMHFYSDGRYAFVGILPKEDGDFTIESLDIEGLMHSRSSKAYDVTTMIPKFTFDNDIEMLPLLTAAGLEVDQLLYPEIVNENPLVVSRVIQNTAIDLNEAGTTAAAVTIIEMTDGAFFVEEPNEQKEVILNRSFAFMIYDTETETPLFIGRVAQL